MKHSGPATTTIAAVSHAPSPADFTTNLRTMESVLAEGAGSGTSLYLFPELNLSGGIPPGYLELAEQVPGDRNVETTCELAIRYRATICAGLLELADNGIYLTHFIANVGGYVGKQRKLIPEDPTDGHRFKSGENKSITHLDRPSCEIPDVGRRSGSTKTVGDVARPFLLPRPLSPTFTSQPDHGGAIASNATGSVSTIIRRPPGKTAPPSAAK